MYDTWNVTQYCQEDVDEEVGIATALEEDTKGRKNDGEDDLANIATIRASLVMILVYKPTGIKVESEEKCCGEKQNISPPRRG